MSMTIKEFISFFFDNGRKDIAFEGHSVAVMDHNEVDRHYGFVYEGGSFKPDTTWTAGVTCWYTIQPTLSGARDFLIFSAYNSVAMKVLMYGWQKGVELPASVESIVLHNMNDNYQGVNDAGCKIDYVGTSPSIPSSPVTIRNNDYGASVFAPTAVPSMERVLSDDIVYMLGFRNEDPAAAGKLNATMHVTEHNGEYFA